MVAVSLNGSDSFIVLVNEAVGKIMKHQLVNCLLTLLMTNVCAQTPEQLLQACIMAEIEKYQPKNDYSQQFDCSVSNKQPFRSPPSDGPRAVSIKRDGYIFLDAAAHEAYKISDGGYTEPFITPRRDEVSSTIWCKAEDKDYGKSGKFGFIISGHQQRVATKVEQRRALQLCTKQVNGLWNAATNKTQRKL